MSPELHPGLEIRVHYYTKARCYSGIIAGEKVPEQGGINIRGTNVVVLFFN